VSCQSGNRYKGEKRPTGGERQLRGGERESESERDMAHEKRSSIASKLKEQT